MAHDTHTTRAGRPTAIWPPTALRIACTHTVSALSRHTLAPAAERHPDVRAAPLARISRVTSPVDLGSTSGQPNAHTRHTHPRPSSAQAAPHTHPHTARRPAPLAPSAAHFISGPPGPGPTVCRTNNFTHTTLPHQVITYSPQAPSRRRSRAAGCRPRASI